MRINNEYRKYLERISRLETPEMRKGQGNDSYTEQCALYERIRRLAKDALTEQINREFAVGRLKGLLKRVGCYKV